MKKSKGKPMYGAAASRATSDIVKKAKSGKGTLSYTPKPRKGAKGRGG